MIEAISVHMPLDPNYFKQIKRSLKVTLEKSKYSIALENRGTRDSPSVPPTTGTLVYRGSRHKARAANVLARISGTANDPSNFRGSYQPVSFNVCKV